MCLGGAGKEAHWTTLSFDSAQAGNSSAGRILMKAPEASRISLMMLPALLTQRPAQQVAISGERRWRHSKISMQTGFFRIQA